MKRKLLLMISLSMLFLLVWCSNSKHFSDHHDVVPTTNQLTWIENVTGTDIEEVFNLIDDLLK